MIWLLSIIATGCHELKLMLMLMLIGLLKLLSFFVLLRWVHDTGLASGLLVMMVSAEAFLPFQLFLRGARTENLYFCDSRFDHKLEWQSG
jgi:hypothetical protein